jgi:hypothetical protein
MLNTAPAFLTMNLKSTFVNPNTFGTPFCFDASISALDGIG